MMTQRIHNGLAFLNYPFHYSILQIWNCSLRPIDNNSFGTQTHTKLMLNSRDKDNNESTSEISEHVSKLKHTKYHLFLYPINIDFAMNEFRIWNWGFDSLLFCSHRVKVDIKSFSMVFFMFHLHCSSKETFGTFFVQFFFCSFAVGIFAKKEFMIDLNAPKVEYFQMLKEWLNVKHSFDGFLCKAKNKFKNV